MAVLTVYPKFQAFDSNGDPLSSGKVYTYISGTSTNKTTYTDSTGGTPNANPVILDSRGEASIWLDTDAAYRFVIKTSADVTINTVDGIIGQQSVTSGGVTLGGDLNIGNYSIVDTTSNEYIKFTSTASAVNELAVTNAATTNAPAISTSGGDTNIGIIIKGKGTGPVRLGQSTSTDVRLEADQPIADSSGNELIKFTKVASAVNEVTISNNSTGLGPSLSATGETNVPITLAGKGTGHVVLGQATSTDVRLAADQPIADSSGNELIKFVKTASAVNELTVTNQSTGSDPKISATGGDTNIGIIFAPKGTGAITVNGTADTAAEIRLAEDTDNGTNYIGLKAPDSVAANKTFILPSADGSSGQFLRTDGSATLSFATVTSVSAATQAELETGSSTTVYTSPGRQQYHPSAAKFWLRADTAGTINISYNITSVTDTGTGIIDVTIATDFSSSVWCVLQGNEYTPGGTAATTRVFNITQISATGTFQANALSASTWGGSDPQAYSFAGFGDQ